VAAFFPSISLDLDLDPVLRVTGLVLPQLYSLPSLPPRQVRT
jgi:hypothetical protein